MDREPSTNPAHDRPLGDSCLLSPLCHGQHLSPEGQANVRSAVVRLLLWSLPAAVLLAVGSVVVDPAQADPLAAGGLSHVCQEVLEVLPLVTDCDSPSPVVWVLGVVGNEAAHLHGSPGEVLLGAGHPVLGVGAVPGGGDFAAVAATRCRGSALERSLVDMVLSAAGTAAKRVAGVGLKYRPTAIGSLGEWGIGSSHSPNVTPSDQRCQTATWVEPGTQRS